MPCILSNQEWLDFVKSLKIIDMLIDSPETTILGRELLFDIRGKRVMWAFSMLEECDKVNEAAPIKGADCPLYVILQERMRKVEVIDIGTPPNDEPDGQDS